MMSPEKPMTTAITDELVKNPEILYRMRVEEYHRMVESGVLEEGAPFELLDGHVVRKLRGNAGEDPMTVSPDHATAVDKLIDLRPRLKAQGCYLRSQLPITLPPFDEPEPDGAVVKGTRDLYRRRHPAASDLFCVIEVADASLSRDRGYKQEIYASAGIGTYIIVVLANTTIEVYTHPSKGG